jgi:hypothetical protein
MARGTNRSTFIIGTLAFNYVPPDDECPFEPKASDWGWLDGRLVALDYSLPGPSLKEGRRRSVAEEPITTSTCLELVVGPKRYGASACLETMPSRARSAQALNKALPSPSNSSLN